MDSFLTCVTLSSLPTLRSDLPAGVALVHHESRFSDSAGLHAARLAALSKVETECFIFVDDDDPFVTPIMRTEGIVYGAERITTDHGQISRIEPVQPWSIDMHKAYPFLIHRAVCNTKAAKSVCKLLPSGEYWTEHLLYFFLAAWKQPTEVEEVIYEWIPRPFGCNTKSYQAMKNSQMFILKNEQLILNTLRAL